MEWCPSSLKAWRRGLVGSVDELMPILLRTYKQVPANCLFFRDFSVSIFLF
jgi:hypothetical protein